MATVKFSSDLSVLNKAIASIGKRGAKLDADIWSCAVGCLAHGQEHGDLTPLFRLCEAMPKGSRVATLKMWAQFHAPVAFTEKKCQIDQARVKAGDFEPDRSDWNIQGASEAPWFEFKPEGKEQVFDLKALQTMLTKIAEGKRKGATEQAMDLATEALRAIALALAEGETA